MTESKLCKSCQNTENCPCWSAKQTGRVISCHFYQEVPVTKASPSTSYEYVIAKIGVNDSKDWGDTVVNMPDSLKKVHDERFYVDPQELVKGCSVQKQMKEGIKQLGVVWRCTHLIKKAEEDNIRYQQQISVLRSERDEFKLEIGALRKRVQVLGAELMDAIQAHEDDTTALRKQVDNQRKSLLRADKQAVKLIRKRDEWKEACAQLALEHNQLIEENEALKEGRVSFCDYQRSLSHARKVQILRSELQAASQAAKLNKEAEVVALELLGEQKEKNKKLKFKIQTSRAITFVVFLLAVSSHYFF